MSAQTSLWPEPTYRLILTAADVQRLEHVIATADRGGWGSMLTELHAQLDGGVALELTDAELRRVDAYAESGDGKGGFQAIYRMLRSAGWRAGWAPPIAIDK